MNNNNKLVFMITEIESLHKNIVDTFYEWFNKNQKDNKITIKTQSASLFFYIVNDLLYINNNGKESNEIDLLSINELYDILKFIIDCDYEKI